MADSHDDATETTGTTAADTDDRREWPRFSAGELLNVTARLATGGEIILVDLSRGGARLQSNRRMLPGSSLSLRLVTPDAAFTIAGKVIRSRIVQLPEGGLGYDLAVAFHEPLQELPQIPKVSPPRPAPAPAPEPAAAAAPPPTAPAHAAPAHEADAGSTDVTTDAVEARDPAAPLTDEEIAANAAAIADALGETAEAADVWSDSMFHITAMINSPGDQIRDLFEGNDW